MDRDELHSIFLTICSNVYYQPPSNVKLKYPCIVYETSGYPTNLANNKIYTMRKRYDITLITRNPDPDEFLKLVNAIGNPSINAPYIMDNLYHYKFSYSASRI